MSKLQETSSLKRKRLEQNPVIQSLTETDRKVLDVIKSKGNMGISKIDIKQETGLLENNVVKTLKTLQTKQLIKEVMNIQNKKSKHFMAVEFEPSKEVSGGAWYVKGNLDQGFIDVLKQACAKIISNMKVATVEGVYKFLKTHNFVKVDFSTQQIAEILESMVLDGQIIDVKSTGFGEYHSIPVGTICYRIASKGGGSGQVTKIGAMASIPCGVCPRINQCTPDGIISPNTCVYYTKWLDFEF